MVAEAKSQGADAVTILSRGWQATGTSSSGFGTANVTGNTGSYNYSSSTVVHGEQSGTVALVKYINVKR